MPPVLDVAFDELSTRTKRDLIAQQPRFGVHQRHRVLQLVAESVSPARLVEAAARPKPASDRLIHQPAIGQHVERNIGRVDLHGRQRVPPVLDDASKRICGGRGPAEAL